MPPACHLAQCNLKIAAIKKLGLGRGELQIVNQWVPCRGPCTSIASKSSGVGRQPVFPSNEEKFIIHFCSGKVSQGSKLGGLILHVT